MKTLTLMRHAKSSWDDFSLSDFQRPLNARGEYAAPLMGEVLKRRGFLPKRLLSSPANRAKSTALIVADIIGFATEDIAFIDSIYESSEFNLLTLIKSLDEDDSDIMIIGHNPALTAIINKLSHFALPNLPTAGVVSLSFKSAWADIKPYEGELLFYEYPKKYEGL